MRHTRIRSLGFLAATVALLATLLFWSGGEVAHSKSGTIPVPPITLREIATDLNQPIHVTNAGDGSNRLFVVERGGVVRIRKDGQILPTPFLDIDPRVNSTCGECGLLSIAFPPDYAQSGVFYVNYTATGNPVSPGDPNEPDPTVGNDTVIARFSVSANPDIADPGSEQRILLVNQPYGNHNGGLVKFGPDGHLYVGMGDGGRGGDPLNKAQSLNTLLGKMLRIAVTDTGTYTIPSGNPFTSTVGARPEIWAYGLRNPWRWSFDRQTGDLYIGDVGQGDWEEINFRPASSAGGENYGWNITEGTHCFPATTPACNTAGLTLPVHEYSHSEGSSITGGYVYRGDSSSLEGTYFFGDFGSGKLWGMEQISATWQVDSVLETGFNISSFGEDEMGGLYVLDYGGTLYRLVGPGDPDDLILYFPLIERAPSGSIAE